MHSGGSLSPSPGRSIVVILVVYYSYFMLIGVGFSFRILLVICKLKRINEELLSFMHQSFVSPAPLGPGIPGT